MANITQNINIQVLEAGTDPGQNPIVAPPQTPQTGFSGVLDRFSSAEPWAIVLGFVVLIAAICLVVWLVRRAKPSSRFASKRIAAAAAIVLAVTAFVAVPRIVEAFHSIEILPDDANSTTITIVKDKNNTSTTIAKVRFDKLHDAKTELTESISLDLDATSDNFIDEFGDYTDHLDSPRKLTGNAFGFGVPNEEPHITVDGFDRNYTEHQNIINHQGKYLGIPTDGTDVQYKQEFDDDEECATELYLAFTVEPDLPAGGYRASFNVHLKDITAPEITVTPDTLYLSKGTVRTGEEVDAIVRSGAEAEDTTDGDLTDKITYICDPSCAGIQDGEEGSYIVTYGVADTAGNRASTQRIINIVDDAAPVGEASYSTTAPTKTSVTATITITNGKVLVSIPSGWTDNGDDSYSKTYTANTDSTGENIELCAASPIPDDDPKCSQVKVTVRNLYLAPPVITLVGANPLYVGLNTTFADPGATAIDDHGDSVSVAASGSVNMAVAGTYTRTYTAAADPAGNITPPITRQVAVVNDTLRTAGGTQNSTSNFLNTTIVRNTIETISFVDNINIPGDAIGSWDVGATTVSPSNGVVMVWYLPAESGTLGLYDVYIGSRTGTVYANTSSSNLFQNATALKCIDFGSFDTSKATSMASMFAGTSILTSLDLSNFDTSKVTNMSGMFSSILNITSLDLSNFDTSKVTDMTNMFYYGLASGSGFTSINLSSFDTSKVTTMSGMFVGASSLTSLDLSTFGTSMVTTMSGMFNGTSGLTSLDLSNFDTSKVTNMNGMFGGASGLTSLDLSNFDTSKVTNMGSMFNGASGLTSLGLSNFDTSKVTTMSSMFSDTSSLTSLDLDNFDTSKVTTMSSMFNGASGLTSLDLSNFDTSIVTTMTSMFYDASSLTTIDLSSFDTSSITTSAGMQNMFRGTSSLTNLDLRNAVFLAPTASNMFTSAKTGATIIIKDSDAYAWLQPKYTSGIYKDSLGNLFP